MRVTMVTQEPDLLWEVNGRGRPRGGGRQVRTAWRGVGEEEGDGGGLIALGGAL